MIGFRKLDARTATLSTTTQFAMSVRWRARLAGIILTLTPGIASSLGAGAEPTDEVFPEGDHLERRKPEEYLALNGAVDAIKAKHSIEQVHLGGQSGGATAVGALLTLGRSDVVCAAAASGGFNALARAHDAARQRGSSWNGCDVHGVCDPYNVTDHVAGIVAAPARRIFLVGDPQDTNTAYRYQQEFADRIAAANHTVAMLTADAFGPQHHGLANMANRVLGWCNAGYVTDRIAALARSNAPALWALPPKPQSNASSPQAAVVEAR